MSQLAEDLEALRQFVEEQEPTIAFYVLQLIRHLEWVLSEVELEFLSDEQPWWREWKTSMPRA